MASTSSRFREVHSAGAVVTRKGGDVLLVHRPRYDDWSFPKGKLDRGERPTSAAVREVYEETGLQVRLGPPLPPQRYPIRGGAKTVHYWVAFVVGDDDVGGYQINSEIDDLRWVPRAKVPGLLTYDMDRATLTLAEPLRKRSYPFIVLRHAKARDRKAWRKDDRQRPLLKLGQVQASRLVPLLAAYEPTEIVSSTSLRCVQTVQPYADTAGWPVTTDDLLSEEGARPRKLFGLVDELFHRDEGVVVCSHRPVLPTVFDALGLEETRLDPGGLVVVHRRKGRIVSVERH